MMFLINEQSIFEKIFIFKFYVETLMLLIVISFFYNGIHYLDESWLISINLLVTSCPHFLVDAQVIVPEALNKIASSSRCGSTRFKWLP